MTDHLGINDKIGIMDPQGVNPNPLTGTEYSDQYKELAKIWVSLPAYKKAEELLDSIKNNQLSIMQLGTGTGKTLVIPKLALHYTNYKGKIAVILPKRTVTLSAAQFSAKTLDVELGRDVGYVYKGSDKKMISSGNKIVYMTTGTIIMKFLSDPTLSEYNVIIIDEAHEITSSMEIIMLLLKNLLQSNKRPDLKVIFMSATIDTAKYQAYFSGIKSKIINIAGQPNHEIKTIFLEKPSHSYMIDGLAIIDNIVGLDKKADLLFFIVTSNDALKLCRTIRPKYPKVYCVEVFADMDTNLKIFAESADKFLELGNYDQKLVMATNVAESSLTIDGLEYVIDSGYELHSYFDPTYYGNVLEKRLISKAQQYQRRGRIGRTHPGTAYILLTEGQFNALKEYPEPEILESDVTMDLLKIIQITESKTLTEGLSMLNQLMDVPKKPYIDVAVELYHMYNIIDSEDKITKIAYNITQFSSNPINRTLFLIYAYQLHCAKEASIILAMMDALNSSLNNLFFKSDTLCLAGPAKQSSKNLIKKLVQKKGDHLTFLKIYQEFKESSDQKTWVRKYGIRLDALNRADKLVNFYYYKIVNLSKIPQLSRVVTTDTKKRLVEALKLRYF